jgi:hypothetical protein
MAKIKTIEDAAKALVKLGNPNIAPHEIDSIAIDQSENRPKSEAQKVLEKWAEMSNEESPLMVLLNSVHNEDVSSNNDIYKKTHEELLEYITEKVVDLYNKFDRKDKNVGFSVTKKNHIQYSAVDDQTGQITKVENTLDGFLAEGGDVAKKLKNTYDGAYLYHSRDMSEDDFVETPKDILEAVKPISSMNKSYELEDQIRKVMAIFEKNQWLFNEFSNLMMISEVTNVKPHKDSFYKNYEATEDFISYANDIIGSELKVNGPKNKDGEPMVNFDKGLQVYTMKIEDGTYALNILNQSKGFNKAIVEAEINSYKAKSKTIDEVSPGFTAALSAKKPDASMKNLDL